ncbi:tetratricopeptide repeat protein [Solitalea longa]|uniref:tetratricopeptide repeat protein n=1 Tax=Solitalea longa TaxID=2079460 RepID=UPI0013FD992E|nr:tetratricopeptide repeat protein [Solitalea longa]
MSCCFSNHPFNYKKEKIDFPVKRFILLISFFLLYSKGYSQTGNVDSLEGVLLRTDDPKERLKITLLLSELSINTYPQHSFKYAEEALRLAESLGSDSLKFTANFYLATAYLELGNYPRGLQLYQQLIKDSQKNRGAEMLPRINGNIGNIYYFQHDYKKALTYYEEALKGFTISENETNKKKVLLRATLLNNIGNCYNEEREFAKAASFYNESLTLNKKINHLGGIANVLTDMGKLYLNQGQNDLALKYYNQALLLRKNNDDKLGLVRSYIKIGELYFIQQNDLSTAEKYFKDAADLGISIGAWETVNEASYYLYQLYKIQGNYNKSLLSLELNKQVNDSLFNQERTRKIAELEMQFDFDQKKRLLDAKQKEKELYYWMGGLGLLLSLTVVSLLFLLQRNKARNAQLAQMKLQLEKRSLESNLELKDKELATNVLHLLNKNELINTISEKLIVLKKEVGEDSQTAVQKIMVDLQSNLQPELLEEFEFRFQQVHDKFYKNLNEQFPNLTPSERRLCAFLKLNMTTKEISAITHQNAKSIDVARTRLRKKLNLTGTDHNLVNFLAHLED